MFCQLFSLQNKSFLCLQHVENKGFQTVIKHRLKAIQKPIKNELGNREKNTKNAHFVLKKCTFRFRDYTSDGIMNNVSGNSSENSFALFSIMSRDSSVIENNSATCKKFGFSDVYFFNLLRSTDSDSSQE